MLVFRLKHAKEDQDFVKFSKRSEPGENSDRSFEHILHSL